MEIDWCSSSAVVAKSTANAVALTKLPVGSMIALSLNLSTFTVAVTLRPVLSTASVVTMIVFTAAAAASLPVKVKAVSLKNMAFCKVVTPVPASPRENGSPVDKDGISGTSGSKRSRSSSTLLFRFASVSTKTIGISSPEFHSSSVGWISILPNPNPTRTVFGVSL